MEQQRQQGCIIHSLQDIEALETINGITIDHIERRAKPITDNTTDPEWRYRSFDGFLGEGESFKELLKRDWIRTQQLGVSCLVFASYLREIIQMVESERSRHGYGPMRPVEVDYTPQEYPIEGGVKQRLRVEHNVFAGYQYSVFFNDDLPSSEHNTCWNEEYRVTNVNLGLTITVAGNHEVGSADYIARYCFFEGGGVTNQYRIEPDILLAIVTGNFTPEAQALAHQRTLQ